VTVESAGAEALKQLYRLWMMQEANPAPPITLTVRVGSPDVQYQTRSGRASQLWGRGGLGEIRGP